jgi:F-type H+-transporting ATPase subunit alpha
VVEVLKQPQYHPLPVEEQVLALYAVTEGHMDSVEVSDIRRFERELREYFNTRHPDLLGDIRDTGKLPEGDAMTEAIRAFKETFAGSARVE